MKKNPHHHPNSSNQQQQQSQQYFQVMSNPLVGSGPNNYQSNYQQNLVQQVYYTGMMNSNKNNGQINGNSNSNNRNTSHRIPHNTNSNSHHGHHFNNNNNTNQSTNSNGAGNYPIPQQYNNSNSNYYSNQHQMQYNTNNNNTHERRNSYHSGNQHHHHHHQQQQHQQPVLSNLSNQNYSKNFNNNHNNHNNNNNNNNNNSNNKPHLQKQISLPENDISNQLKHTYITSPLPSQPLQPPQQQQQQQQPQIVNANAKTQPNTDNLDQKPVCNYVNDLSPVYENKNLDAVDTTSNIAHTAAASNKETNTPTNLSTTSDKINEANDETSGVFDDVAGDDECCDVGEIVHVIENDEDVYEDEPNSLNDDTNVKQTNLLTSTSSSESSLNTNNSTSSSSHTSNTKTLSDLVQKADNYKDKSDYYRHLVYAIDQLYPDCKWPLHSTWTFWFIKHDNNKNWSDNLISVLDVSYVEDFWSGINYLLLNNKSNLINQGDLTFFKKGIKPMWEDEQNKSGGCWLYQVNNQQQYKKINDLWLETLLALIGDNYCDRDLINQVDSTYFEKKYTNNVNKLDQENEHICDFLSGTILMHRGKNDKLSLWTKNYKDDLTTRLIGKIWKNVMKLSETFTINFEAHETKNNKNASNRISYKE